MNEKSFENFNQIQENQEGKHGWIDCLKEYQVDVKNFIVTAKDQHYDGITEFHFSGMNSKVLTAIYQGSILPDSLDIYYKDNQPEQIHAVYKGGDTGHSIDVYISGQALQDFLEQRKSL